MSDSVNLIVKETEYLTGGKVRFHFSDSSRTDIGGVCITVAIAETEDTDIQNALDNATDEAVVYYKGKVAEVEKGDKIKTKVVGSVVYSGKLSDYVKKGGKK